MMGRLNGDAARLFYEFCLEEVVPADHLVRKIDATLDAFSLDANFIKADVNQVKRVPGDPWARPLGWSLRQQMDRS